MKTLSFTDCQKVAAGSSVLHPVRPDAQQYTFKSETTRTST